ncbi:MAG: hypothetical protein HKN16_06450 [Saprospiraceae bacterium]|nr:hypothetical protein [Saprospiraceae bacterium]
MVRELRSKFNASFKEETYQSLLQSIARIHDHFPKFRIAETPVFIPEDLARQLHEACDMITDVIVSPDFKELSRGALLEDQLVPNEDDHTIFLQMDFGICKNEDGSLIPQLIEVQGFPSLYFFQDQLANHYKEYYDLPENYNHLFGMDSGEYFELLKKVCIGETPRENVVLLEVEPKKQTTQVDFWAARKKLGICTCCVTDIIKEGNKLFYKNEKGEKVQIKKLINRVIFDELLSRTDLKRDFSFKDDLDVEWVGHPHWFFRISKHTLPLLKNPYVPETYYLDRLEKMPEDLQNYVLKPLYSFAGTGVIININKYDIEAIKNPENYILQKKVEYAQVIETPSGPSKCELRMLMIWEKGQPRPRIVNNLARLSKGQMVGVRYNKDKDWVGGSVGFFPV